MKKSLLLLSFLLCAAALPAADEAPAKGLSPIQIAAQNTERLLTSLRDGDLETFTENSSQTFQEAMTPQTFADARSKLGPILSQPSHLDYLGLLNKGSDTVYLYRLRPDKGGVDSLVTLSMRGSTVIGFVIF